MGNRLLPLYIFLAVFVVIATIFGFYYLFNSAVPPNLPEDKPTAQKGQNETANRETQLMIKAADSQHLFLSWHFLPGDTARLEIFRTKKGTNDWIHWKTINVNTGALAGGSTEIVGGENDDLSQYSYYVESVTSIGLITWISATTEPLASTAPTIFTMITGGGSNEGGDTIIITGAPPPGGNENPAESGGSPPPTTTPPTDGETENPSPGQNPGGTPPISPPPAEPPSGGTETGNPPSPPEPTIPPGGNIYYSPSGQIIGITGPPTYTFLVEYQHGNTIHIAWQNLPENADTLVVYRSPSSNGPWIELLKQSGITPGSPGEIGLIDDSITSPFYYRMEALASGNVAANYGPNFLPGINQ